MAYELKDGQGALFRNDRKKTDTHPDWQGSIKLPGGAEVWISGWIKSGRNGEFISLSLGKEKMRTTGPDQGAQIERDQQGWGVTADDDGPPF